MAASNSYYQKVAAELERPPPVGHPHGVPVPGTERPGRTPIYRHFLFRDQPLLTTIEPAESVHDLFELSVKRNPNFRALGVRKWIPEKQDWDNKYTWQTYAEVAERRKNMGAGIVEVVKAAGYNGDKYGVGIWSQNTPEWQITGMRVLLSFGCSSYLTMANKPRSPSA
jgi:long-chain acyl-CoA synthetase